MYITFIKFDSSKYHCNGISALHKCEQDPNTWDYYSQYRNQDPTLRQSAVHLMASGIKLGQAASFLNT